MVWLNKAYKQSESYLLFFMLILVLLFLFGKWSYARRYTKWISADQNETVPGTSWICLGNLRIYVPPCESIPGGLQSYVWNKTSCLDLHLSTELFSVKLPGTIP